MKRLILFAIVGVLLLVGAGAVALYHFFGWKGMVAFPFLLLAGVWLAKVLAVSLAKRVALSVFRIKAGALRDAAMEVNSLRSVPPPESDSDFDSDFEEEAEDDGEEPETAEANDEEMPDEPMVYVELDVTITPDDAADEVRWEPSELILTSEKLKSLADLEDKKVGTAYSVEIWDGLEFEPDDEGKYPGEQRLKIIFEVRAGTRRAWLHYYHQPIGELELPIGTMDG